MGSRDSTRELAREAATRSGVEQSKVEEFLPALAAMLQGGMQKQTPDSSISNLMTGLTGGTPNQGGGIMSMLSGLLGTQNKGGGGGGLDISSITSMLDADGDGSPLDDILEKVMR